MKFIMKFIMKFSMKFIMKCMSLEMSVSVESLRGGGSMRQPLRQPLGAARWSTPSGPGVRDWANSADAGLDWSGLEWSGLS